MSTLAKLQAQRERLLERLDGDLGPNEREEIQLLLSKVETALTWLDAEGPVEDGGQA